MLKSPVKRYLLRRRDPLPLLRRPPARTRGRLGFPLPTATLQAPPPRNRRLACGGGEASPPPSLPFQLLSRCFLPGRRSSSGQVLRASSPSGKVWPTSWASSPAAWLVAGHRRAAGWRSPRLLRRPPPRMWI